MSSKILSCSFFQKSMYVDKWDFTAWASWEMELAHLMRLLLTSIRIPLSEVLRIYGA